MTQLRRDLVVVVALTVGVLVGLQYAPRTPEPDPRPVVSSRELEDLAALLRVALADDELSEQDERIVTETSELVNNIEQGEVVVEPSPSTTAPTGSPEHPLEGHAGEGDVGETPSPATTAQPGTEANPLDGNASVPPVTGNP